MSEVWTRTRGFVSTADKTIAFLLCGVLAAIPFFFLICALVKREAVTGGYLAYSSMSVVILVFGAVFFVDTSELLVGDSGLARRIGGRVCMQIPWTGIKRVRETFRTKARNGPQIIIQIIPTVRTGIVLRFRRMLVVSDQIEGFDELIEILNARVDQYSIRVEICSNGIWRQNSKLVAAPEL
jgi:hypothetical protein